VAKITKLLRKQNCNVSQINPVKVFRHHLLKINFNIILSFTAYIRTEVSRLHIPYCGGGMPARGTCDRNTPGKRRRGRKLNIWSCSYGQSKRSNVLLNREHDYGTRSSAGRSRYQRRKPLHCLCIVSTVTLPNSRREHPNSPDLCSCLDVTSLVNLTQT
jgi:hypothetical protein